MQAIDQVKATKQFIALMGGPGNAMAMVSEIGGCASVDSDPRSEPEPIQRERVAKPKRPGPRKATRAKSAVAVKPADDNKPAAESANRRPRASAAEVEARKAKVLEAARSMPAECKFARGDIEKALGEEVDPRTMTLLVEEGKLGKEGDRKNTRYWVKP